MKLFYPELDITLVESNTKKAQFLQIISSLLRIDINISNKNVKETKGNYDIFLSRGFSDIYTFIKLTKHLYNKTKTHLIFYKGKTNKIFEEYKDLVDFWIIENEPLVYVGHSYFIGLWPPKKKSCFLAWRVLNNLVLLHKTIYQDFHKKDKSVKVGVAKNIQFTEPFSKKSVADRLSLWITDYLQNEYFLNKTKKFLDFIGLNYYFRCKIKFPFSVHYEGNLMSDIGWEIFPQGIYYVLKKLKKYHFPIYITENGVADQKDKLRKDFIKNHLYWIWKAINEGVKVKGYFHWSLIDNYEWLKDFKARFGLIEVELPSLQRKPRKSAFFYAEIAKNNYLIM